MEQAILYLVLVLELDPYLNMGERLWAEKSYVDLKISDKKDVKTSYNNYF